MNDPLFSLQNVSVTAVARTILRDISVDIPGPGVFGLVGPSGAGKSTLLKVLNRMTDLTPGFRVSGRVLFRGRDIYSSECSADEHRTQVGMLFQQPVIFPKSILQNVVFGLRHVRATPRCEWMDAAERALTGAALWEEVRDRLHESALRLSVGQQQRLCLARTLALDPEVILMDEPTSALDPQSTAAIEDLIRAIAIERTIVLVTHNHDQACRLAPRVAALRSTPDGGRIAAAGACGEVITD